MKERQAGHLLLLRPLRAALRGARRLAVGENQSMATVWSFPAVLASLAGSCLPLSSASVSGPAELTLAESEGEPGRWVVRSAGTARPLLEIVPDAWSGNANVYAPGGTIRVGHFWSQLLMFSGGNWLTDRVESEGFRLISFEVLRRHGESVRYRGTWQFRDYFTSEAEHLVWVRGGTVFHHVRASLKVLRDIPKVTAVWVELMNDADAYRTAAAKTTRGVVEQPLTGTSNMHYMDGLRLQERGWIAVYGPRKNQNASAALVPLGSSHAVRPRVNDSHCDNIELHLLDPRRSRALPKGRSFSLEYLLLIHGAADGREWIDGRVRDAEVFLRTRTAQRAMPGGER